MESFSENRDAMDLDSPIGTTLEHVVTVQRETPELSDTHSHPPESSRLRAAAVYVDDVPDPTVPYNREWDVSGEVARSGIDNKVWESSKENNDNKGRYSTPQDVDALSQNFTIRGISRIRRDESSEVPRQPTQYSSHSDDTEKLQSYDNNNEVSAFQQYSSEFTLAVPHQAQGGNDSRGITTSSPVPSHFKPLDLDNDVIVDHPIVRSTHSSSSLSSVNKVGPVNGGIHHNNSNSHFIEEGGLNNSIDPIVYRPRSSRGVRPSIRPVAIKYTSSRRSIGEGSNRSSSAGNYSPYNIPLPLSATPSYQPFSSRSSSFMTNFAPSIPSTPQLQSRESPNNDMTEPRLSRHNEITTPESSPSRPIGSPSGTMSTSMSGKRRAAPTFPSSPRPNAVPSHRELIARSAGLPPIGYAQTPTGLKVPPTPQWSPAFNRSGYKVNQRHAQGPYKIPVSPFYPQPPHSAAPVYIRRQPGLASAPTISSPRLPDQPGPPPAAQIDKTATGSVKLKNVPVAWVVRELNRQAPSFWSNVETTDCRIVIPWTNTRTDRPASTTPNLPDSAASVHSNQPGLSYWPPTPIGTVLPTKNFTSGIGQGKHDVISAFQVQNQRGRRGSLPEHDQVSVMVFPLHQDYLITQSKLFRQLLSSVPAHLDMPIPPRTVILDGEDLSPHHSETTHKGARIIPSAKGEPVTIMVPLPNPECFGLIAHWLYWGDASVIDNALCRGSISWTGLIKCIVYLDLDDPIKKVVGSWWRRWIKTEGGGTGLGGMRGGQMDQGWLDGSEDGEDKSEVGTVVGRRRSENDAYGDEGEGDDELSKVGGEIEEVGEDVLGAFKNL